MKIRFKTDQASMFQKGIDSTTSIVLLDIDPSIIPKDQRDLISKHLLNADGGCDVVYDPERAKQSYEVVPLGRCPGGDLIEAKEPTLASLLSELKTIQL